MGGEAFSKNLSLPRKRKTWVLGRGRAHSVPRLLPPNPALGQKEREEQTGAFLFVLEILDKRPYPF